MSEIFSNYDKLFRDPDSMPHGVYLLYATFCNDKYETYAPKDEFTNCAVFVRILANDLCAAFDILARKLTFHFVITIGKSASNLM